MIILIDNYDSFSYNLYQLIGTIDPDILVIRNDACSVSEIESMNPKAVFISPGPGRPENAGICTELVRKLSCDNQDGKEPASHTHCIPLFGVCLGHQAICQAFGATISYAEKLMHGKQSELVIDPDSVLFQGIHSGIRAARYHSLSVKEDTLPDFLRVTARASDGEVMAVEHRTLPIFGVQFHPESVMTPDGLKIIKNFLDYISD